jgi:LacI family transcriptional regulator
MIKKKRVIVAVLNNGIYGRDAARGIYQYAASHGNWQIQFDGASNYPGSISRLRRMIRAWKPHGIVGQILHGDLPAAIKSAGMRAVSISDGNKQTFPTVTWDAEATGRVVARYFVDQTMPNFAYAGRSTIATDAMALSFMAELKLHDFECDVFRPGDAQWQDNDYERLRKWLRSLPKPVGIMASDDYRAREISEACIGLGLKVPDDIAIVGVMNDPMLCSLTVPLLSSVSIPARQIGHEAARMLDQMMHGKRVPKQLTALVPSGIVTRQSSDVVAVSDPDLNNAVRFIREHACDPIDVSDVVKAIALSRRTLERKFLQELGRTPREEIIRIRISRAKTLLIDSTLKIADISRTCGFGRHIKFPRLFKHFVGKSPSEYRAQYKAPQ